MSQRPSPFLIIFSLTITAILLLSQMAAATAFARSIEPGQRAAQVEITPTPTYDSPFSELPGDPIPLFYAAVGLVAIILAGILVTRRTKS